jgi:hypothetical protein
MYTSDPRSARAGDRLLGVLGRENDVALEATARGSAERGTSMMSESRIGVLP